MVKIEEHMKKIERAKQQVANSKGYQKVQYIKCLKRLQKQLRLCEYYMKERKSG